MVKGHAWARKSYNPYKKDKGRRFKYRKITSNRLRKWYPNGVYLD